MSSRREWSWKSSLILALSGFLLSVAIVEVGFRLAEFDFEFKRRAFERTPIFYRQPLLRMDDGLFRRPGPARWEGQVLTPLMERMGVPDHLTPEEKEVAIFYDRHGFRNPDDLEDWEIVVVGDSFTELGHLPYEDLFTSRLGELLSVRVKNLGVSWTGPMTHVSYLKHYGKANSTKHAILAFYEGNDLEDLVREARQLRLARRRRALSLRPPALESRLKELRPQSSFLKASYRLILGLKQAAPHHAPSALFQQRETSVPVSFAYMPSAPDQLPEEVRRLFERSLTDWARRAEALGLKAWLLYLPCKRRVLHGQLRFTSDADPLLVAWAPNDLPRWVQHKAEERGMTFVDATPALMAAAGAARVPYNTVWDNHLNREGAEIVARVLADALRQRGSRPSGPRRSGRKPSG